MSETPPDSSALALEAPLRLQARRRVAFAAAPALTEPQFALLDDAEGRFIIDAVTGVISLADESFCEREQGLVHEVRLRVSEPAHEPYELPLRLCITGCIPQVDGVDDLAFLAGMGDAAPMPRPLPAAAWAQFSATLGARRKCPLCGEAAAFGALLAAPLPAPPPIAAALALEHALPKPASREADWGISPAH